MDDISSPKLPRNYIKETNAGLNTTTRTMSTSNCVFKIITFKPDLNSPKFQLTELDEQSGFIHLSTGRQIPYTCNSFFCSVETLYIIKFAYDKLKANMKWEPAPGGEELFPHLYSDLLTADVDSTREFHKRGESWVDVLGNEPWLLNGAQGK
jgi:uncharacterized protein (DUF952 family)